MCRRMKERPSPVLAVSWMPKTEEWILPAEGIVTSSCGERISPVTDETEFHDGLDIAVAEGTPVVAVKSGEVTSVKESETLGLAVTYMTTDGFEITYAHLQESLVSSGEEIRQGQAVALSGSSGWSTGPHLHYCVKKDGVILDPMVFVDLPVTPEVEAEYEARGEKMP